MKVKVLSYILLSLLIITGVGCEKGEEAAVPEKTMVEEKPADASPSPTPIITPVRHTGETIELEEPTSTTTVSIRGVVMDTANTVIANAEVALLPYAACEPFIFDRFPEMFSIEPIVKVTTNSDGVFSANEVPFGNYFLILTRDSDSRPRSHAR